MDDFRFWETCEKFSHLAIAIPMCVCLRKVRLYVFNMYILYISVCVVDLNCNSCSLNANAMFIDFIFVYAYVLHNIYLKELKFFFLRHHQLFATEHIDMKQSLYIVKSRNGHSSHSFTCSAGRLMIGYLTRLLTCARNNVVVMMQSRSTGQRSHNSDQLKRLNMHESYEIYSHSAS